MKRHYQMFLLLLIVTTAYVSCIKHSEYDVASKDKQPALLKYSINLSLGTDFGVIGHMYLESIPNDYGVTVHGWIEKNLENSRNDSLGEDAEQVREYQLGEGYALNNSSDTYNGFTLPLRLRHLAAKRIDKIKEIHQLVRQIESEEQRLLAIGKSLYKDFSRLSLAKDKDYLLSGLDNQKKIAFAGKRFSKSIADIKREIEKRRNDLATVDYNAKKLSAAHNNYNTTSPVLAYDMLGDTAAIYQQLYAGGQVSPITPSFNAKGDVSTSPDYFEDVLTQIVILRQAKLQLASALCAIYEPSQVNYYFSMGGVQEHLLLTMTQEDDGNDSFVRYQIKAQRPNNKEFDFGYTDHDDSGKAVGMRLNLKPLGGAKGFSKLDLTLEDSSL